MIPAGSGRLPLSSIARADVLWLNHAEPEQPIPSMIRRFIRPETLVVRARYRAVGWLFRRQLLPLDALPDRPAGVFAGVAHPEGFFAQLRQLGVNIDRTWVFPDHHRYVWTDLQAFEAWRDTHVMITTEKDAARLPPDESVWALRVEPVLHSGEAELRERLELLVGGE
jgi:tetraacyldisaccharide 4'-kinase